MSVAAQCLGPHLTPIVPCLSLACGLVPVRAVADRSVSICHYTGRQRARTYVVRPTSRSLRPATANAQQTESTSGGSHQIDVTLKRPLGMTLAEDTTGKKVFVDEIVKGGNAEESGKVKVGDVVLKVSATVLKSGKDGQYEKEGYGQRPYDNWEKIMFDCTGQDFDTVMSAIDSNNPRWGINDVTLVLQRST